MICAEDEIGLGSSHDGIIILPDDIHPGTPAAKVFDVVTDVVFEIGLTPNRTDAFSHYGVARDLAAALNFRNKAGLQLVSVIADNVIPGQDNKVTVNILRPDACPRYSGLVIEGIKVAPSPLWLQERLKAIGQKPINNVVDVTNYILHSYGQPLHAFNLDAIEGKVINVGMQAPGTAFKTLDGNIIELHEDDLMINHQHGAMCIAGVYGGFDSGVNEHTKAIFLESAYFNPGFIRRTSLRHGLRTDAALHFEKGIDPAKTVEVLKIAAGMILNLAGGVITSSITDIISDLPTDHSVSLHPDKVRKLTGAPISDKEILEILKLLEIKSETSEEKWQLTVPAYRSDVTRDVDVIEDILRIYGYNNIIIPQRMTAALNIRNKKDAEQLYRTVANLLCANGFNEVLNNSLTRSKDVQGMVKETEWVRLLSSINAELDILRPCMQVSMLGVLEHNLNRSQKNLKLFEFGKTYHKKEEGYAEMQHIFLAVTGDKNAVNWKTPPDKADFYYLKGVVNMLLQRLGVKFDYEEGSLPHYDYCLLIKSGTKELGVLGKLSAHIGKKWDIRQEVIVADLFWDTILKAAGKHTNRSISVPRFPSTRRDLALLVDKNIKFTQIKQIAEKFGKKILKEVDLFDVYEGDKIEKGKKSYAVSFIFREEERTLNDKEVDAVMTVLMNQYQQQLNAIVRGSV
jgi:phenylalanyl-tRNA synthetase beta chain